jgi:hypothetical protein
LKLTAIVEGFNVITNSRHLSGADVPQQFPSRAINGLVQERFGEAERSTFIVGVILSQYCPNENVDRMERINPKTILFVLKFEVGSMALRFSF